MPKIQRKGILILKKPKVEVIKDNLETEKDISMLLNSLKYVEPISGSRKRV